MLSFEMMHRNQLQLEYSAYLIKLLAYSGIAGAYLLSILLISLAGSTKLPLINIMLAVVGCLMSCVFFLLVNQASP
jgi:hypothetical protein